jgi:hypothetical protein
LLLILLLRVTILQLHLLLVSHALIALLYSRRLILSLLHLLLNLLDVVLTSGLLLISFPSCHCCCLLSSRHIQAIIIFKLN